eukprot:gene717-64_t
MYTVCFFSFVSGATAPTTRYDQFLPPDFSTEFYDGITGHQDFSMHVTVAKRATWDGESTRVNVGHWRCWSDILRDMPLAYHLQTAPNEEKLPLSARSGSTRAHVASERLTFMINMYRSGYPLSSACCHPITGDRGNPSCWIDGQTSYNLCCGKPVLPRRCVGDFGPAFVLHIDDDGSVVAGEWVDGAANPYDCASLDELSLYFQSGVVGGSDKDSGFHNYLKFAQQFLFRFGTSASVLEMGVNKGSSLALWSLYFPDGIVFGVDTNENTTLDNELIGRGANITGNVKIEIGDCTSESFAADHLSGQNFHLMIDDASHVGANQITTFEMLFPLTNLLPGGIYWVEDVTHENALEYFRNLATVSFEFGTDRYALSHLMALNEFQIEIDKDWRFLVESVSFHGELVIVKKRDIPSPHISPY